MSLRTRRRVGVLLLSAALHALLLGALALRLAPVGPPVGAASADVSFVAAPALVRWARAAPVPRAPETPSRAIVSAAAPRYVGPPQAATGDASDATDLFGPVFADGQWPRPVLVRSEPCDPHDPTPQGDDCRRQLLLIGLATEAQPGSNPRP